MASQRPAYQREKLYSEVWAEPATEVAKRYRLSSVALGKICKGLNVPTPKRGYWAKRAAGKIQPTPPLPPAPKDARSKAIALRKGRRPDRERIANALYEGRAYMGPPIVVPEQLDHPHELVAAASRLLSPDKVRNGVVPLPNERCLDVVVSPLALPRALRVVNALILALEARGFPVEVTEFVPAGEAERITRSNLTRVLVNGEWVRFGIGERLRQHQPELTAEPPPKLKGSELEWWMYWNRPRIALIPTGKLVLQIKEPDIGVRLSWRDERHPIEVRLNDFIKQLFVVADAKKQVREADDSWREAFEVESQRKRDERDRVEEERRNVAILRDAIARQNEAREARQLLRDIRDGLARAPAGCGQDWVDWIELYANKIDR